MTCKCRNSDQSAEVRFHCVESLDLGLLANRRPMTKQPTGQCAAAIVYSTETRALVHKGSLRLLFRSACQTVGCGLSGIVAIRRTPS
jgi:hypothetical protein